MSLRTLGVVLFALLVPGGAALAKGEIDDPPPPDKDDQPLVHCNPKATDVTVSFKPDIEVKELLTWAFGFTCKRYVYDNRLIANRHVTLIAPGKISKDDAYQLFVDALATAGIATVPYSNGTIHLVDSATAKHEPIPILKKIPAGTEQVVRYVVRPTYVQAATVTSAFATVKSDAGDIVTVGQLVLVADYASHVRDMISLLSLVDVPGGTDGIYAIPVVHADATKVSATLERLLATSATASSLPPPPRGAAPGAPAATDQVALIPPKIIVDERTNTLLVAGSEAGYHRVKAIVDRIDIPLAMEDGASLHVYPLGSAIATELAQTMTSAIQQKAATSPMAPHAAAASAASPLDALPVLEGQVNVVGDKPSNSLLVTASAHDYLALKDIIRQLDQPRRQVYIEAMILEVAVGSELDLGTSSHAGTTTSNGSIALGGVQTGAASTLTLGTANGASSLASMTGLIAGLVGSSTSLLGTSIPSYAVLFNALATSGNTDIVSEPSIIAVDNEDAKYQVGTNIPYQKGLSFPTTTSGSSPFNSVGTNIDRKDLVLELDIKPHISFDDTVLLEVKHSSNDLQSNDATLGPTWSTRTMETRVLVHDQHTVVIGGLMQTRDIENETKVPVLGDIPLLGHLFKYTTHTKRKSDLLILLTPYIIRNQADLESIRERKAREHEEFRRGFAALSQASYVKTIDYGRKRGLVEEINRAAQGIDEDIEARQRLQKPPGVVPGPVEGG